MMWKRGHRYGVADVKGRVPVADLADTRRLKKDLWKFGMQNKGSHCDRAVVEEVDPIVC